MVVVEELHDVKEKKEGLAELSAGVVSLVPVPLCDGDGESLESLSVGVGRGGGGGNVTQPLVQ